MVRYLGAHSRHRVSYRRARYERDSVPWVSGLDESLAGVDLYRRRWSVGDLGIRRVSRVNSVDHRSARLCRPSDARQRQRGASQYTRHDRLERVDSGVDDHRLRDAANWPALHCAAVGARHVACVQEHDSLALDSVFRRDGDLGAAARRCAPLGPADGPHFAALSSSAEELIATIGLEPGNAHPGRHLEPLQDLSGSRIDPPQIALVTFPGAVPKLTVDPGDPGDEAVRLDRAKNRPCFGIDLMDLPVPILPHPERPFGPREP